MRKKTATYIVLAALVCVLMFVIGMRAGQHDKLAIAEERAASTAQMYQAQIASLEHELELERQTEYVLVTYEYKPLPVDYENIGNIMPEETDAVLLAKMYWGEGGAQNTFSQLSACGDCAFNRVKAGYGTLREVITAPNQFMGYNPNNPVDARLYDIAKDTILRQNLAAWEIETFGETLVNTTLPSDFLWFEGNGKVNTFRNAYEGGDHITP